MKLTETKVVSDADMSLIHESSPNLVEETPKSISSEFELNDRDNWKMFTDGDGVPKCASGHNVIYIVNPEISGQRFSTVKTIEDYDEISNCLKC